MACMRLFTTRSRRKCENLFKKNVELIAFSESGTYLIRIELTDASEPTSSSVTYQVDY